MKKKIEQATKLLRLAAGTRHDSERSTAIGHALRLLEALANGSSGGLDDDDDRWWEDEDDFVTVKGRVKGTTDKAVWVLFGIRYPDGSQDTRAEWFPRGQCPGLQRPGITVGDIIWFGVPGWLSEKKGFRA